ncbi:hypothetical protein CWATWH0402_1251 [Crocosphaera watsonii WH 0402]|uniref:Uncharacterized protein n=1 Tax=Crocosphaera watsonii WH 0402 TaxID=1284629 RepID=T2JZ21_CROWT|nr:hypothetical protein CWATWH0402_1251 [Crocosphaera watsonii WH 0402]
MQNKIIRWVKPTLLDCFGKNDGLRRIFILLRSPAIIPV